MAKIIKSSLTRAFDWLVLTQFFGTLSGICLRVLIIFFFIADCRPDQTLPVALIMGALLVVPFLLFPPLGGALAEKFSKQKIILTIKLLEIASGVFAWWAFSVSSGIGLYVVMFLLTTLNALFGPAKYGIVPELVKREQLSYANSLLASLTYLAIVLGSISAALLVQIGTADYSLATLFCLLFALLSFMASWKIGITLPVDSARSLTLNIVTEVKLSLLAVKGDKYLIAAILGSAYFLFLCAFAQINLIPFAVQVDQLSQEQAWYLVLLSALGVCFGSFLTGRLSGRNVEFGAVPIGTFGLAVSAIALFLAPAYLPIHAVLTLLFGICAGLFLVPLQAFLQWRSPRQKLGRILAVASLLSWCGVFLAVALSLFWHFVIGLSVTHAFLFLGLLTFALTMVSLWMLPDFLLRFLALGTMRLMYRLNIVGAENVPLDGPALLVSNHASWVDALLLLATQQRRIRFVLHRGIYNNRWLKPLFLLMGVIPVAADASKSQLAEFVKESQQALQDGFLVCIFAEGMITRNGMLHQFQGGLEAILKGTDYPVIPVYLGGAWGTIFSYAHGKPFSKLPTSFPYTISIHFGIPLPSHSKAADVQQAVAELNYDYFAAQKERRTSLIDMFISNARSNWHRKALSDSSDKNLSYGKTLCATLILAGKLSRCLGDEEKVGLLLPSSVGGALTNLAVSMLRKIPVNLNYTASPEAVQSALDQCQIKSVLTSRKFMERFSHLPLPEQVLYVEDFMQPLTLIEKLKLLLRAHFLPVAMLLPGPRKQGEDIATVIFSSGSTGDPKGVLLSQHNIISNIEAIRTIAAISPRDNICSALPFFHSLGYTATLWLPLLSGFSACYHVNPMEAAAITKLVRKHRSTLLLTTPTFLAAYMRRAKPDDFSSLRLVVTGAEKLKDQVADHFNDKFGIRPLEGYGATELAPLVTLSLPNIKRKKVQQAGNKGGSVGRPVPGVVLRVVDPDKRTPLPQGEAGLILVKGPNLMVGYLGQPDKTAEVICDGWYVTGDIGFVDRDGFLHVTDRLARFSKIAGEMVPHIKVEELFYSALSLPENSLAVTSLPDDKKGEQLVVLYTAEAGELSALQQVSHRADVPNLWRPPADNFVKVKELPLLGTGKLDLQGLRRLAEEYR